MLIYSLSETHEQRVNMLHAKVMPLTEVCLE